MDGRDVARILRKEHLLQPKVLLIEDCQFDTVFLRKILDEYYPMTLIDHVETRAEALGNLETSKYDIVFLDLFLTDTNGYQDVGEIYAACEGTPLIVVTAMAVDHCREAVKEHGADGIIDKRDLIKSSFPDLIETAVENLATDDDERVKFV